MKCWTYMRHTSIYRLGKYQEHLALLLKHMHCQIGVYFFDALDLDNNLLSKLGQIQYSLQSLEMLVLEDRGSS